MVEADGQGNFFEKWSLRLAKTHSKSISYFEIRSGVKAFETQKMCDKLLCGKYSEKSSPKILKYPIENVHLC